MTKGTNVHDGITEDPQMNQPIEADSAIQYQLLRTQPDFQNSG